MFGLKNDYMHFDRFPVSLSRWEFLWLKLGGRKLKRSLIAVFLIFIMLLAGTLTVYAEGSGNVDGGGGSLNHGTKSYNWPGNSYQGVRVTVVDTQSGEIVAGPVDFSNNHQLTGAVRQLCQIHACFLGHHGCRPFRAEIPLDLRDACLAAVA